MTNWSKLPSDPLGFFELTPGFDRKDLKRSYGKLIKQYKPETHPAEFQRIREAYEMLESQNRYGIVQEQMARAADAWSPVLHEANHAEAASGDNHPRATDSLEFDLCSPSRSPQEKYKWLKALTKKTPQTYYALATLSDLVEPQSSNMYLKWLLTGIKEFPSDPGLLRLVSEYLAAFTPHQAAAGTLQTIAKLITGDDFFRITETLWDRLLTDGGFELFAKSLATCERMLKHKSLRPRLAFYIHILRRAMWIAPEEWIAERLKFIEAHGSELGAGMDEEIDLLGYLHRYRHHDRQLILNKPLGNKVDQLIAAYCKGNSPQALAEITVLCDELARNGRGWQQLFPVSDLEKLHPILWLCLLITSDVSQQTGVDFGHVNAKLLQQQADAVVGDIEKTIHEISSRIFWLRARSYVTPLLVLWLGPLILTYGWSYWGLLLVTWTMLAVLSYSGLIVPFLLKKRVDARVHKLIEREYERLWRPRMFRYVQACHAPARTSIEALLKSAHELGKAKIAELVLSYAIDDRALGLFNQLQLFVH